jgi:hypothetical protein
MSMRLKAAAAMLMCMPATVGVSAQGEAEYRAEIGGGAGLMSYQGDLNGSVLKGLQPAATLMAKYKPNPRMAWSLALSYGRLKGSYDETATFMPATPEQGTPEQGQMPNLAPYEFKRGVADVALAFEYNFLPYGTGREYRGAKPLVPFVTAGLGVTAASNAAMNMHLGAGVKYKMAQRWNLTLTWRAVFTTTDKLDGLEAPYGIKSQGMFKNTDGYTHLQLTLSYDLWAKCKTCHNEYE